MPDADEIRHHFMVHASHVGEAYHALADNHAAALQRIEALESALRAKVSFGYLRCGIAGASGVQPDTAVSDPAPL